MCFGETTEITGGENIVADRCATPEVREQFMKMFNRYQEIIERHKTNDLSDSQPTKGNIAGGLTTIEEKALGNIQKIGKKCKVVGVLDKAETPTEPGPVVHGFVVRGRGDGDAVRRLGLRRASLPDGSGQRHRQSDRAGDQALTANPRTARTMSEHIDYDCSGLLQREKNLDQTGDELIEVHAAHVQRPAHRGRSARPPRVRADAAVRSA